METNNYLSTDAVDVDTSTPSWMYIMAELGSGVSQHHIDTAVVRQKKSTQISANGSDTTTKLVGNVNLGNALFNTALRHLQQEVAQSQSKYMLLV